MFGNAYICMVTIFIRGWDYDAFIKHLSLNRACENTQNSNFIVYEPILIWLVLKTVPNNVKYCETFQYNLIILHIIFIFIIQEI